jgi:hypothetical protein
MEGRCISTDESSKCSENMHIDETNKIMPEFASCIFESLFSLLKPLREI